MHFRQYRSSWFQAAVHCAEPKKKERNATHEENGDGDRELFGANVLVLILTTIDLKSPAAAAPETRANLCQYYVYGPLRNGQRDRCMWEMWHKL